MKKLLKKNQVIITALVIMIAVAGYLNFTQGKVKNMADKNNDAITASAQDETDNEAKGLTTDQEGNEIVESDKMADTGTTGADAADAGKENVDAADGLDQELMDLSAEDLGNDDLAAADSDNVADGGTDNTGEAVLVSNMINRDYFESAKLTREQTRAKNKEMLMEIVDNKSITEKQKQDAIDDIINMTAIAEKEGSAEILLGAKGFQDVVVSMMDGGVDVIVNADSLTEQQMAQIEDIVKRKTGVDVKNIVITPVGVEDAK